MSTQFLRWLLASSLWLNACSSAPSTDQPHLDPLEQSRSNEVDQPSRVDAWAWGERVEITDPIVTQAYIPATGQRIAVQNGLLQLPPPPDVALYRSSRTTADQEPDPKELEQQLRRAALQLQDPQGKVLSTRYPYGSAIPDEVSVVWTEQATACPALAQVLRQRRAGQPELQVSLDPDFKPKALACLLQVRSAVSLSTDQLVQTVRTQLDQVRTQAPLSGQTELPIVEKVYAYSLNQVAYAYDPTCKEIGENLDPIGRRQPFSKLFSEILKKDLNLDQAPPPSSSAAKKVRVIDLGGGAGKKDNFTCRPKYDFADHGGHIKALFKDLVPNVKYSHRRVCEQDGVCKTSEINRILGNIHNWQRYITLVNMSMSGPRPSEGMYSLLQSLSKKGIYVIVSAGNVPGEQYPAHFAYLPGQTQPKRLPNVFSVGATGWVAQRPPKPHPEWGIIKQHGEAGTYRIAAFTTPQNATFVMPGVNLCPSDTGVWRCWSEADKEKRKPQSRAGQLGITGTSFAAPVLTAVIAARLQYLDKTPRDLYACLKGSMRQYDSPKYPVEHAIFSQKPCD